jgi:hypothetical protein
MYRWCLARWPHGNGHEVQTFLTQNVAPDLQLSNSLVIQLTLCRELIATGAL